MCQKLLTFVTMMDKNFVLLYNKYYIPLPLPDPLPLSQKLRG